MEDSDSVIRTYPPHYFTVECYLMWSSVITVSRINFPFIFLEVSSIYDASQLLRYFRQWSSVRKLVTYPSYVNKYIQLVNNFFFGKNNFIISSEHPIFLTCPDVYESNTRTKICSLEFLFNIITSSTFGSLLSSEFET
jgi:hypothetical protein